MRPRCIPVAATLAARGEADLTVSMVDHIDGCDDCSDALAEHRRLAEGLASLSQSTLQAPAEILPRVMDGIGPWAVPDPEPRTHRLVVAAAAAVATAATAAAAGTAVLVHLHRQRAA